MKPSYKVTAYSFTVQCTFTEMCTYSAGDAENININIYKYFLYIFIFLDWILSLELCCQVFLVYSAGISTTGTRTKNAFSSNKMNFALICRQTKGISTSLFSGYGTVTFNV